MIHWQLLAGLRRKGTLPKQEHCQTFGNVPLGKLGSSRVQRVPANTPGPVTDSITETLKNTGKSHLLTSSPLIAGVLFRVLLAADQT
jgi:hypothetical protein